MPKDSSLYVIARILRSTGQNPLYVLEPPINAAGLMAPAILAEENEMTLYEHSPTGSINLMVCVQKLEDWRMTHLQSFSYTRLYKIADKSGKDGQLFSDGKKYRDGSLLRQTEILDQCATCKVRDIENPILCPICRTWTCSS